MDDFVFDPKKYEGHSPGPWKWDDGYPPVKTYAWKKTDLPKVIDANGNTVMWFGDEEPYYPTEGTVPGSKDALLIADAPALLAYIERLLAEQRVHLKVMDELAARLEPLEALRGAL